MFGNTDYRTAMADYYGVPNGMIAPHVGMMIKGKPLDVYGDLLTTVCMPGGGWTKQHDTTKWLLTDMMAECEMDCTTEVFGLFSACISQVDALNGQPARKRQAMVPDFHVVIAHKAMLMELKMVHQGVTYFNPTTVTKRNGGVEKRAGKINREHQKKAQKTDKDWGPGEAVGTVMHKARVRWSSGWRSSGRCAR